MGERCNRTAEASGSIPLSSTNTRAPNDDDAFAPPERWNGMNHAAIAFIAAALLLGGCGAKPPAEESPGAAARYLDNVVAHEPAVDHRASDNGADEQSPASGKPDVSLGQAPIFSREAVAPR